MKRTVWSSSHSNCQKSSRCWAHRFSSRSGNGPVTHRATVPRSRFISRFTPPLPFQCSWMLSIRPVMSSSSPVMARSSNPLPLIWMRNTPPLTWISWSP